MTRKGRVELSLGRALRVTPLQPGDEAAVELARSYARMLDEDQDALPKVGARFLETLESLGMTPKARSAVVKGAKNPISALDELRARRERPVRPPTPDGNDPGTNLKAKW